MHGRVRVIRTAEQEKARKEKKAQIEKDFCALREVVWQLRSNEDYSETQLNQLASLIDTAPDTNTFWNYRREIIKRILVDSNHSLEKNVELLNAEIHLTTQCLLKSPKSYSVWHHRCWVMKQHPSPQWNAEIEFCNSALKVDERNFHCWDYRRFVVKHGSISSEAELKYTDSLIENNMSNYSAWHYRSQLLSSKNCPPVACPLSPPPQPSGKEISECLRFDFSQALEELDLVHNAIFTDPADQSPWFYYWWLLGHGERKVYLREVYLSRILERLVVVFTEMKPRSTLDQLEVVVKVFSTRNSEQVITLTPESLGGWNSCLKGGVSEVWWLPITSDVIMSNTSEEDRNLFQPELLNFTAYVCVKRIEGSNEPKVCKAKDCPPDHLFCLRCNMDASQNESLTRVALDPIRLLNPMILPTHEPEHLRGELTLVRELVSLEPRNKWALLTLVSLLRFIRPPGHNTETTEILHTLSAVDPQRTAYYQDLQCSHAMQDKIADVYAKQSRKVVLQNIGIRHLRYLDWYALMTKIDFSNNFLVQLPDTFSYLLCVSDLNLDDNELVTLQGISNLPSLENLSIQRNKLTEFNDIEDLLHCPKLRMVVINGNKVTQIADLTRLIAQHPGSKRQAPSFSLLYDKTIRS